MRSVRPDPTDKDAEPFMEVDLTGRYGRYGDLLGTGATKKENVLAESRMMIPNCRNRLEVLLADLKATLEEVKGGGQDGPEITEAESTVLEVETLFEAADE